MLRSYENNVKGLTEYFRDVWTDKRVSGFFEMNKSGEDHLIHAEVRSRSRVGDEEIRKVKVIEKYRGDLRFEPIDLILQINSKILTLTVKRRVYSPKFEIRERLEQSFIEKLKKIPPSYKKDKSGISACRPHIEIPNEKTFTETVNLEDFLQDFSKLDEWIIKKLELVAKEDLYAFYNGRYFANDGWIMDYAFRVTESIESAFKVELIKHV